MSTPAKLTNLDPEQIVRYSYDDQLNGSRVILVGSDLSKFEQSLSESVSKALQNAKFEFTAPQINQNPVSNIQFEYKEIEKPIIVEKTVIQYVDKPVIIKEIEYREIEKQVIVDKIKIEYVEKPIFVNNSGSELPKIVKVFMGIQTLVIVGLLLTLIIK